MSDFFGKAGKILGGIAELAMDSMADTALRNSKSSNYTDEQREKFAEVESELRSGKKALRDFMDD